MKKILLICLDNINNAGDNLLGITTEYLVKKSIEDGIVERIQFYPKYKQMPWQYKALYFLGNVVKWLAIRFKDTKREYILRNICYKIQLKAYYTLQIRNASSIIYPIGMLKYSTQNFSYIFELINSIADKYQVPVLMSAMSVEKRKDDDWRYHQVVRAVNKSCVKAITTRDGEEGLARLRKDYVYRKEILTDFVGDPALWIPEVYKIRKAECNRRKKLVGIGLIRKGIYADYKEEHFSDSQMLSLYSEIITELEDRGYDWVLFSNGIKSDYIFGEEILDRLSYPHTKLLPAPISGEELVKTISNFDVVFGARLHACITSVAMGVPVVGLLWDNKLDFFSKTMGIRQFFLTVKELNGNNVVNKIEEVMNHHFDFENRDFYKKKTEKSIKRFVDMCKNISAPGY